MCEVGRRRQVQEDDIQGGKGLRTGGWGQGLVMVGKAMNSQVECGPAGLSQMNNIPT